MDYIHRVFAFALERSNNMYGGRGKFVNFEYCKTCKYFKDGDKKPDGPCHDCLDQPVRDYSEKPINYKKANV